MNNASRRPVETARAAENAGKRVSRSSLENAPRFPQFPQALRDDQKVNLVSTDSGQTQLLGPGNADDLVTRTTDLRNGTSLRENPDGSTILSLPRPDPVWGLNVQRFGASGFSTPGGLGRSASSFAEATLVDPLDPLSVQTRLETLEIGARTSTRSFDGALRRWLAVSAGGRISQLDLDPLGRPLESARVGLEPVRFVYDANGRLASVSSGMGPEERVVLFDYDLLGRLVSIVDPLSREVSFEYDSANRLTLQVLPGGRELHFDWDQNGNLTGLTPPARPEHGFDHTAVDLVSEYAPPPLGPGAWSTLYEHNLDRQPTRVDRPDGREIDLGYDAGQRLTTVTTSRGMTTIAYEAGTGHVSSLTTPEGNALAFSMDGPVVLAETWSGEIAGSVERTYDADLRLATISVNGANPIAYDYDEDGLLVQAGDLSLTRSPQSGLLTATTLGVVTTAHTYNSFGELVSMTASVSGAPIYESVYTRDKLGRITTEVETIESVTTTYDYGYDLAGRLDTVAIDGILAADYDFDPNGNRTQKWTPGGVEAGTYDDQDRLLTYSGSTFTYRPSGELATETAGAETTRFDYDELGNLLAVDLPGGTEISYVVDARNRRIGRRVDGTLVQGFLWQSQLAPIAELDGAGNVVSRFVHATRVNVPDHMIRGGVTYRILTDHMGSPRLVVDTATGAIVQRMDYDEWGVVLADTNPGWTPFGFAGGLYEAASGLVRFGARDLDANSGRWTSKDPLGFAAGSSGLFAYVQSEPVNRGDPTGLFVGGVLCKLLRPLSGQSLQEALLAGAIVDGASSAYFEFSGDGALDARNYVPTVVNIALDAQRLGAGKGLVTIGGGLATAGGAGLGGAVVGVAIVGLGGWEIGRGADALYRDLGGRPLEDVFFDLLFDDGWEPSPTDFPPGSPSPSCEGTPSCP